MGKINTVTEGHEYVYDPVLMDITDPKAPALRKGMRVTVIHPQGCPPPNTMGHAHVALNGLFAGLVHCNSLQQVNQQQ